MASTLWLHREVPSRSHRPTVFGLSSLRDWCLRSKSSVLPCVDGAVKEAAGLAVRQKGARGKSRGRLLATGVYPEKPYASASTLVTLGSMLIPGPNVVATVAF